MKRMITMLALAATMVLASASVALADPPTCSDFVGGGNHGDHVTDDYATPGDPGAVRGGPGHFTVNASPGASFCGPGNAGVAQDLPNLSGGPPAP